MAITEKLERLRTTKADIKSAIEEKGQDVGEIPFSQYPKKIRAIEQDGSSKEGLVFPLDPMAVYKATRPSDWLQMPEPQDNEIYLLFHIPDGLSSLIAVNVTCTGSYTIALGTVKNGIFIQSSSTENPSGTKYQAELFAKDYGDLTSDGFKQVMIKLSGTDILTMANSTHKDKYPYSKYFSDWNIVEISCRLPKGTSVNIGSSSYDEAALRQLRYFSWLGENQATTMSNIFHYCHSLIAILHLDTSSVKNMSKMFSECHSLKAIPQFDTSSVTDMSDMFSQCSSMITIPFLSTGSVKDMTNMFYYCSSLISIPHINTKSVTKMGYMFDCCYSLITIPPLDFSFVERMDSMFNRCYSLISIPQLETPSAERLDYMFCDCTALISVGKIDISHASDTRNMFSGCESLSSVKFVPNEEAEWNSYTEDLHIKGANLNHDAIVELFKSLPTASGTSSVRVMTLTLTNNPGVKELTDEEKKIATDKNWTLTL